MNNKKKILFLHQNFPGQYKHLAPELAKNKNYDVQSLSLDDKNNTTTLENLNKTFKTIKHNKYKITDKNVPNLNRLTREFETKMIRAQSVAKKCLEMKENGYQPDLILAHPGWGEGFLLKEVWSDVKIINYFEFYYNTRDSDVDFDLKESNRPDYGFELTTKLIARNAPFLSAFNQSDMMIAPTNFQKDTAPEEYKNKIKVIHDGVDTDILKANEKASISLTPVNTSNAETQEQIILTKKDKVIAFVNRNLEPYRGYHIFMRSLPDIIKKHPDAYILIIGGDGVSYGATPKKGTYKDIFFNEIVNDIPKDNKIKFLGYVPYNILLNIFCIADVHVYFTYPFVLSWSMLESMSLEGLIVGSKTPPVEEVIKHKENGLLVDFFDTKNLSKTIINILDNPESYKNLRKNARDTIVENYDLKTKCLPEQLKIVQEILK
tara:strand:+ start:614 stop:1915 length:1302 start_codon:yes stop_codon:yes gene_type:complete